MISKNIPDDWGWTETGKSLPYSVACLVFCLVMVPAGRLQDKIGPRLVASMGGLLVGIGMIMASFTTSSLGYLVWFGVLAVISALIGASYGSNLTLFPSITKDYYGAAGLLAVAAIVTLNMRPPRVVNEQATAEEAGPEAVIEAVPAPA